jgi:hypothetical protein
MNQLTIETPVEFSGGRLQTMGGSSVMTTFSQDANAVFGKNIFCAHGAAFFSQNFFPPRCNLERPYSLLGHLHAEH